MYNEIIELGRTGIRENAAADQIEATVYREVFAEVKSVSQSEFYTAAQSGLTPAFKFVLADYYDYNGEELVRYNGELYRVIRTYRAGVTIELTVEKKAGVQDGD